MHRGRLQRARTDLDAAGTGGEWPAGSLCRARQAVAADAGAVADAPEPAQAACPDPGRGDPGRAGD